MDLCWGWQIYKTMNSNTQKYTGTLQCRKHFATFNSLKTKANHEHYVDVDRFMVPQEFIINIPKEVSNWKFSFENKLE
jgi:hypothetical protein